LIGGVRLADLVRLRLELVASRIRALPAWQAALFAVALAIACIGSGLMLPVVVPVFDDVDGGLTAGTLALVVACLGVFGIHLLIAEGAASARARAGADPMDLLPVPPRWTFYLVVLEEVLTDPVALLSVVPAMLGIALSARDRTPALLACALSTPLVMAVVAGLRLTVAGIVRTLVSARTVRVIVRSITYGLLLFTVAAGGVLVYDLFALTRYGDESLEPLGLASARIALALLTAFEAHPVVAHLLPPAWPVLALTGGPGGPLWLAATVLASILLLRLMAAAHGRLLAQPRLDELSRPLAGSHPLLVRFLSRWLPVSPEPVMALEVDVATTHGLLSEAIVEGTLLVGSLLLLVALAPQLYARSFLDGLRFLGGLLTLLLTTPAATLAREGAGLTLRLVLPMSPAQFLLSKVPVIAFRNVLLVAPAALAMTVVLPPAELATVGAAAAYLSVVAVAGALAAIGAGMVVAPLVEEPASFGRQVLALGLCALTLAPLTLLATTASPYHACAGVLATGLMVAGLWQKALSRMAALAHPPPGRAPGSLLGDSALGALLYVLVGTTLPALVSRAFWRLDPDTSTLIATLVLQVMTIRYTLGYLWIRRAVTGDPLAIAGRRLSCLAGAAAGLAGAVVAVLYGQVASELLELDPGSTGGGPLARMVAEIGENLPVGLAALACGAILAPLSEELLFRRLLFCGLVEATGRFAPAAALSGLLFALMHPPAGFPVVAAVGVVAAALYHRSGSLAACWTFHMAFNGAQLALLAVRGPS
jgi:membrane protease YdiL (CAAX protease family)